MSEVTEAINRYNKYTFERRQRPARKSFAWFVVERATGEAVSGSYKNRADAVTACRVKEQNT